MIDEMQFKIIISRKFISGACA